MRRVAREEGAAYAVAGHLALVAVEARGPAHLAHPVVGAEGEAQVAADLFGTDGGVLGDLAAAVPADDAVPAVAEVGHDRDGVAVGVADHREVGLLVEPYVGEDDGADHGAAGEGQAECLADGAAHAVRADQVGRAVRRGRPVVLLYAGLDAVGVLVQAGHPGPVPERDTGLLRAPLQQPLDLVLRSDQYEREAGGQPGRLQDDAAEEPHGPQRVAARHQFVGEAARVELFEAAGVHGHRAGQVAEAGGAPLQQGDAQAGDGEVPGEQQSGGAGADHEDVGGLAGARGGRGVRGVRVVGGAGIAGHGRLQCQHLFANGCWSTLVGNDRAGPLAGQQLLAYSRWHG